LTSPSPTSQRRERLLICAYRPDLSLARRRVRVLIDDRQHLDGGELIEAPPGLDGVKDELLVRTSGRSATSSAMRVSPGSEGIIESLVPNLRSVARKLRAPRGSVTTQMGWWLRTKARRSSQSMRSLIEGRPWTMSIRVFARFEATCHRGR